jgi:hypothetical protein
MKSEVCKHSAVLSKLGRLTAGLVTLAAIAACGAATDKGVNEVDPHSSLTRYKLPSTSVGIALLVRLKS